MTDVFISYAQADRARVAPIAQALQGRGFDVLWDFATPSTAQADAAKVVLVVWSAASVGAVQIEANHGKDREALVPIFLDGVTAPVGYGHLQGERLDGFPNPPADAAFERLVATLQTFKDPVAARKAALLAAGPQAGTQKGIGRFIAPGLILLGIVLAGFLLWPKGAPTPDAPPAEEHQILGAQERYGLSDTDIASLPAQALIRKAMENTNFETLEAAAAEDKLSLGLLCLAQYYGVGTARNDTAAADSCGRANSAGVTVAGYVLSQMTRRGEGGITANASAADTLLKSAADAGDARAQHDIVLARRTSNPALARATAEKCAAQGNVDCQFVLAQMLAAGEGGAKDLVKAKTTYDTLEAAYYAPAIRELGKFYRDGVGVPARDLDEAVIHFKRAAVLDDGESSFLLGQMAEAGQGMPKSESDALQFYKDAAEDGYAPSNAAIARLQK